MIEYDVLKDFITEVTYNDLKVYGISIYHNNEYLHQQFHYDDRINLFSGSKTYTALAIGICIDLGLCELKTNVGDIFKEYNTDFKNVTIENLLKMNSGIIEIPVELYEKPGRDWLELFFKSEFQYEVSEKFSYSNTSSYVLGRIVQRLTARNLKDFLVEKLFNKMEIYNVQWSTCPSGYSLGATGLYLSTSEYLKLGILFLNQGFINSKKIISNDFLESMSSDFQKTDGDGYGMHVWECVDGFRADGMFGQFCLVFPKLNLSIAITSHETRNTQDILKCVYKTLIPKFENKK